MERRTRFNIFQVRCYLDQLPLHNIDRKQTALVWGEACEVLLNREVLVTCWAELHETEKVMLSEVLATSSHPQAAHVREVLHIEYTPRDVRR